MKYLLFFTLLVFGCNIQSQNIEKTIVLKDIVTNLPIEDATVFVVKTKQIAISNSAGEVTFVFKGASNIQVSHASYVTQIIRSSSLKENETIVLLKKSINDLDEIILTKQHPQKILKGLIDISTKNLTVPARLKIYCREFFKFNGAYTYYNDGILNFQISGTPKSTNTKILVEQNRSLGVVDDATKDDVLGYNLNNIMENYYNFRYLAPLMETSAKKEFNWLIRGFSSNNDYFLMTASPVAGNSKLQDDFTILYDYKKKLIIEVTTNISPISLASNERKKATTPKKIYKSIFKTIYRLENSNYFLLSSKEEIGFEKKSKTSENEIEVRNYFVTTNFSTQGYSYKKGEVFEDKTLHNKKNLILTNYWNTSGLKATDEEQLIIDSISEKTPVPE
jgi:hypothetical protein